MELTISTIMLKLNKLRVVSPHDFSVSPSPLGTNLGFELGWNGLGALLMMMKGEQRGTGA